MRLGHRDSHVTDTELLPALFTQDDLQMRRLRQVHEVLRIAAPELVLSALIVNPTSTVGVFVPIPFELLLNSVRKLHQLARL